MIHLGIQEFHLLEIKLELLMYWMSFILNLILKYIYGPQIMDLKIYYILAILMARDIQQFIHILMKEYMYVYAFVCSTRTLSHMFLYREFTVHLVWLLIGILLTTVVQYQQEHIIMKCDKHKII